MPRLVGINHIAVEVGDIEDALAFFGRNFDDVQLRGRAANIACVDMGDQFIGLATSTTHVPDHARQVGLVVDDLEEAVRRVREAGVAAATSSSTRGAIAGNSWTIARSSSRRHRESSKGWASWDSRSPSARSRSYEQKISLTDL